MSSYLLDSNVAIALTVREHEHHDRALSWLAQAETVALCPIVQGALIRYLVRVGSGARASREALRLAGIAPVVQFWADSLSYADVPMDDVRGHRQVTDVYLAALAASRGARLATFDVPLTHLRPDQTILVPELP